jgi:hypothetical protein
LSDLSQTNPGVNRRWHTLVGAEPSQTYVI